MEGSSMSIIKEKILKFYAIDELKYLCSNHIFFYLTRNHIKNIPKLCEFAKFLDIKTFYTTDDFVIDYPVIKNFKEFKSIFNIYCTGLTLKEFEKKYAVTSGILMRYLKKGFFYNSQVLNNVVPYLSIDFNIENFEIEIYKTHIELYGNKQDLIDFKNKYNLRENPYLEIYKNKWHLAFSGLLAEYIKYHISKKD